MRTLTLQKRHKTRSPVVYRVSSPLCVVAITTSESMGNRASTGGGSSAVAVTDIHAPASIVWECISDLEAAPDIIGMVISVEREVKTKASYPKKIEEKEKELKVGTTWKETRSYRGHEVLQYKVVTDLTISQADGTFSVQIDVNYGQSPNMTWFQKAMKSIHNTCTLTVTPGSDHEHSQLVGTYAIRYGPLTQFFLAITCANCRFRDSNEMFQREMNEYGAEAEKRYKERALNESK